jgi:X-Pro dipeptidyl-peptidase
MPEHSYRIYKAAKEKGLPAQIYYHQNGHGGPPPISMMNKWFTKYLHGVDNGVDKEENKAFIVREYDDPKNPTVYKDYPNPNAQDVVLHLTAGGNTIGGLTIDEDVNEMGETLIDDVSFSGADLAKAKSSEHRLLYVTPKLKNDIHISGVPKVSITLSSNKAAANLSVWLVSLPWDNNASKITENIITRGWADPKNYKSLTNEEDLVKGRSYTVNFDLQPDDQIIKAGQQIGLMIFSSDQEFTLHPKPGTQLTIELDKTTLTLPIVNGEEAYRKFVN